MAKRISLDRVARIIEARREVCLSAAKRHADEGEPHMAASERCAASELAYVLAQILPKDQTNERD